MRRWPSLCSALAGSLLLARAPLLRAADEASSSATAPAAQQPPPAQQPPAQQPPAPEQRASSEPAPAQRRAGLVLGIAGGLLTSSARGYPNDVAKIDVPQYEAHLGAGVATGGAFWIGGALADWLTLGVGAFGGGSERGGLRGSGGVFTVRIEAFPLFYRGGHFQDLGVLFTAGTGAYSIHRGKEKLAEGAGTSAVGVGAFYEPWRFWQLSFGPQIEYSHQFSDSMSAHTLVLGLRSVFYGGP
jgi:hypothetical protein